MLAQPWRVPALGVRLARCWGRLVRHALRGPRPDVVVVGYLGHFDVHLARLLFGRRRVVLDHLIGAADTGRDRQMGHGLRQPLLRAVDAAALDAAKIVVVDTEEHLQALPAKHQKRAVVVPVGSPDEWFAQERQAVGGPLRVGVYGFFTPLPSAPTLRPAIPRPGGGAGGVTVVGPGPKKGRRRPHAGGAATGTRPDAA